MDNGLTKVHNAKCVKEVVRQLEHEHGDASKENVPIPPSCHPEKDESRYLIGKEITECQKMIGIFQWIQSTNRMETSYATTSLSRFQCSPRLDHWNKVRKIVGC